MKLNFNRLRGGVSALAAVAQHVVDDDQGKLAADDPNAGAPSADQDEDDDEDDEAKGKKKKEGNEASDPPKGDAPPAPAPGAEEPQKPAAEQPKAEGEPLNLSAEQRQFFNMGAAARDMAVATVFASEHIQGREAAAAELLAGGYDADKIVATLAKLPKGAKSDAMLDTLRSTASQPQTPPGSEGEGGKSAKSVWDRVGEKQGWKK